VNRIAPGRRVLAHDAHSRPAMCARVANQAGVLYGALEILRQPALLTCRPNAIDQRTPASPLARGRLP
jgi:hypothetical protein